MNSIPEPDDGWPDVCDECNSSDGCKCPVETRLTAEATEQFIKSMEDDIEYFLQYGKGYRWLVLAALKHAEAFRDKSESELKAELQRVYQANSANHELYIEADDKRKDAEKLVTELRAKLAEQREILEIVDEHGCSCMTTDPEWHSTRCVIPRVKAALEAK